MTEEGFETAQAGIEVDPALIPPSDVHAPPEESPAVKIMTEGDWYIYDMASTLFQNRHYLYPGLPRDNQAEAIAEWAIEAAITFSKVFKKKVLAQ
jgi:hypothetical protein